MVLVVCPPLTEVGFFKALCVHTGQHFEQTTSAQQKSEFSGSLQRLLTFRANMNCFNSADCCSHSFVECLFGL